MFSIRYLAEHTAGNAATLFALAMVPVVCVAGAAVDYAHITKVRATLAGALDASLAAVGRTPLLDPRADSASLRADMETRLGPRFSAPWKIDSLSEDGGQLVATVSADVATSVARLIGIAEVPIRVSAEIVRNPG